MKVISARPEQMHATRAAALGFPQDESIDDIIREYIAEFTSDKAAGEEGYLADKGMIPLPADMLKEVQQKAGSLTPMM